MMLYLLDRLPYFERAAAKRWFRLYVADPIPEHIRNLRGGYRGNLSRGIIISMFDFQPPFERPFFPRGWELRDVGVASVLLANLIEAHTGIRLAISKSYIKPLSPLGGASAWLLVDENAKRGALYESGIFASQLEGAA